MRSNTLLWQCHSLVVSSGVVVVYSPWHATVRQSLHGGQTVKLRPPGRVLWRPSGGGGRSGQDAAVWARHDVAINSVEILSENQTEASQVRDGRRQEDFRLDTWTRWEHQYFCACVRHGDEVLVLLVRVSLFVA